MKCSMQDALQPVNAALWSSFRQVASFVSTQPDLKFQIPSSSGASSWLLNTYLDKVQSFETLLSGATLNAGSAESSAFFVAGAARCSGQLQAAACSSTVLVRWLPWTASHRMVR